MQQIVNALDLSNFPSAPNLATQLDEFYMSTFMKPEPTEQDPTQDDIVPAHPPVALEDMFPDSINPSQLTLPTKNSQIFRSLFSGILDCSPGWHERLVLSPLPDPAPPSPLREWEERLPDIVGALEGLSLGSPRPSSELAPSLPALSPSSSPSSTTLTNPVSLSPASDLYDIDILAPGTYGLPRFTPLDTREKLAFVVAAAAKARGAPLSRTPQLSPLPPHLELIASFLLDQPTPTDFPNNDNHPAIPLSDIPSILEPVVEASESLHSISSASIDALLASLPQPPIPSESLGNPPLSLAEGDGLLTFEDLGLKGQVHPPGDDSDSLLLQRVPQEEPCPPPFFFGSSHDLEPLTEAHTSFTFVSSPPVQQRHDPLADGNTLIAFDGPPSTQQSISSHYQVDPLFHPNPPVATHPVPSWSIGPHQSLPLTADLGQHVPINPSIDPRLLEAYSQPVPSGSREEPQLPLANQEQDRPGKRKRSDAPPRRATRPKPSEPTKPPPANPPAASYPCAHPGCNTVFRRKGDMKRHFTTIHSGKLIPCPSCTKMFGRADSAIRHILRAACWKRKSPTKSNRSDSTTVREKAGS